MKQQKLAKKPLPPLIVTELCRNLNKSHCQAYFAASCTSTIKPPDQPQIFIALFEQNKIFTTRVMLFFLSLVVLLLGVSSGYEEEFSDIEVRDAVLVARSDNGPPPPPPGKRKIRNRQNHEMLVPDWFITSHVT